jgi:hypothetical protein
MMVMVHMKRSTTSTLVMSPRHYRHWNQITSYRCNDK